MIEEGYRQATEAFQRIVVSPLRRTMEIAAMIGMCITEEIDFTIPGDASSIIVVMNGLSDCAAHVGVAGGALAAIRRGYIDGVYRWGSHGSQRWFPWQSTDAVFGQHADNT